MFLNESIVGQVFLKGAYYPIAVGPGKVEVSVFEKGVAFAVGVASDIEPVAGPAFSMFAAGKQFIDFAGIGIGRVIADELLDLLCCWAKTGEGEMDPAQEGSFVGTGRRLEALRFQGGEDEEIDGVCLGGLLWLCGCIFTQPRPEAPCLGIWIGT